MKAVIIIDMQRDFVEPGRPLCVAGAAETVPACVRLLDHATASHTAGICSKAAKAIV